MKHKDKRRFSLVKRISARRSNKSASSPTNATKKASTTTVSVATTPTDVLGNRESLSSSEEEDSVVLQDPIIDIVVPVKEVVAVESRPIQVWLHDVDALIHSDEMSAFLHSTGAVAIQATKTALHVATLPVTLPIHVVSCTTNLVVGTCASAVGILCGQHNSLAGETTSSHSSGLIPNVVPLLFRAVCKMKDDLGSTIMGAICPFDDDEKSPTRRRRCVPSAAGESSAEQDNFLDRLRLDYPTSPPPTEKDENRQESLPKKKKQVAPLPKQVAPQVQDSPQSSDVSKFLLRVCDLGLSQQSQGRNEKVYHIELSKEFSNKALTLQALDKLVENGLDLISSCPDVQFKTATNNLVNWKPENNTAKLLRKQDKLSEKDWTSLLSREVLVWSGKFVTKTHKADVPVFLSRGILNISPLQLLELFWDDERTRTYNKFSLGRSTSMEMERFAEKRSTKIVQSETQVPFTGLSVVMSTLMHARQLESGEYVIVSRSLKPGRAGCHLAPTQDSKNELVWGVNLIRAAPGDSGKTDLTSVSQLSSSMVLPFLTHKVGLMAVESFFNAMREKQHN